MSKIKMLGYVFNCDRNSGDGKYGYGYGYGYRRYGSYGHYGRYRDTGKRDKKEDLSGRVIKDSGAERWEIPEDREKRKRIS